MPEYILKIRDQITERWNSFTTAIKIRIIAAISTAVVLLVVLTIVLSAPNYVKYASGLEPSVMNSLKSALDDKQIRYKVSEDASIIYVDDSRMQEVSIAADELGVMSESTMDWQTALDNSLATNSSVAKKKIELAFQDELETKIEAFKDIRKATLVINATDESSSFFNEQIQSSAMLTLDIYNSIRPETIQGIVSHLSNAVKNLDRSKISIMDTNGNILYDGTSVTDFAGSVNNKLEHTMSLEEYEKSKLMRVLMGTGEYDHIEIYMNLEIDYDEEEMFKQEYKGQDGGERGVLFHSYLNEAEGKNTSEGGEPGTGSNDGTTDTMINTGSDSETSSKISENEYYVDKIETKVVKTIGEINRENSSVSVVLKIYDKKYEDNYDQIVEAAEEGALDDVSWEAYKKQIDEEAVGIITPTPELIDFVKNATRIDDVEVMIRKVPMAIDAEKTELPVTNYIYIALMVLLVAVLGFIIYKSTAPEEIEEIEPELSVEEMLTSTKEKQELEDIEFDDKSDIRKQIEKFVDDNPEAVALLMRNWLNEDWE